MNRLSSLFVSKYQPFQSLGNSRLLGNIQFCELNSISKRITSLSGTAPLNPNEHQLKKSLHTGYHYYKNSNKHSLDIKHDYNKNSVFNSDLTMAEYLKCNAWGMLTSVDVKKCNPKKIRDKDAIKQYVLKLCDLIEMKRYGPTVVTYFGANAQVEGYSMMQFIETSMISGHFANCSNSSYIDIFSCQPYDPKKVADFTKEFFEGADYSYSVLLRE